MKKPWFQSELMNTIVGGCQLLLRYIYQNKLSLFYLRYDHT